MNPAATVVVSPRDAFVQTRRCLDRLLECTPAPRRIVVVDGGSPPPVAELLAATAATEDLVLVRSDHQLTPNEARNLGAAHVTTTWVAFVDNDAYVEPRWLERLVACGEETGAALVVPLLCIGPPDRMRIHLAGGECAIHDEDGIPWFFEDHTLQNEPLEPARRSMVRRPCGLFEFHAVLVRTAVLREVGPFDEGLRSLLEHDDFALALRERGHTLWFEPAVLVTYLPPKPLRGPDRAFFVARWSDDWNRRSAERFRQKWHLAADDHRLHVNVEFGAWMRARAYRPYRSPFVRVAARRDRVARSVVDRLAQRRALRRYRRSLVGAAAPTLVHRASWMDDPDGAP